MGNGDSEKQEHRDGGGVQRLKETGIEREDRLRGTGGGRLRDRFRGTREQSLGDRDSEGTRD